MMWVEQGGTAWHGIRLQPDRLWCDCNSVCTAMRLLQIHDEASNGVELRLTLHEFHGAKPPYAILSHRWREEEISFADMMGPLRFQIRHRRGWKKLEMSCRVTLQYGLKYLWVDTCCIDKSSSAELSEAINSMFSFYGNSSICIAYLDDVDLELVDCADDKDTNDTQPDKQSPKINHATWFQRGWTLQELIAPHRLEFFSRKWEHVGSKFDLSIETSEASGVTEMVLRNPAYLRDVCVSEKMSWAAHRVTTRPEDQAYSLMGLFGVSMPALYGESGNGAFRRLQLEILRTTSDHTLFAWESEISNGDMLAPSIRSFLQGADYRLHPYDEGVVSGDLKPDSSMTNAGLHIQLPMIRIPQCVGLYFAFLACLTRDEEYYVAVCLRRHYNDRFATFSRITLEGRATIHFPRLNLDWQRPPLDPYSAIWIAPQRGFFSRSHVNAAVDFEVIIKSSDLMMDVRFRKQLMEGTHISPDEYPSIRRVNDQALLSTFHSSGVPLRYYFGEKLDAGVFDHDVITLIREQHTHIVFGEVDGNVWFYVGFICKRSIAPFKPSGR